MSHHPSPNSEPHVLPNDVLSLIAYHLPCPLLTSENGPKWQNVSSIFLKIANVKRYSEILLDTTSHFSIRLLQHLRSFRHLHGCVKTVHLSLHHANLPRDLCHLVRHQDNEAAEPHDFVTEILQTAPLLTNVSGLFIYWTRPRPLSFLDYCIMNIDEETFTAIHTIHSDLLLELWKIFGPLLISFTARINVDLVPALSSLIADASCPLEQLTLSVYGLKDQVSTCDLSALSRAFFKDSPRAFRRISIDINLGCKDYNSSVRGFFEDMQTRDLPLLKELSIETGFRHGEEKSIARLVSNCVRTRSLSNLSIVPILRHEFATLHQDLTTACKYARMITECGYAWAGLGSLQVFMRDDTRHTHLPSELQSALHDLAPSRDVQSIGVLLSLNPNLRRLILVGRHLNVYEFHDILFGISKILMELEIHLDELQPKVFDKLAEQLPQLETLHLHFLRVLPDPQDGCDYDSDAFSTTGSTGDDQEISQDSRSADSDPQPKHGLFYSQMAERSYSGWNLKAASVILPWSQQGCIIKEPPRGAIEVADALSRAIPGLLLLRVDPGRDHWNFRALRLFGRIERRDPEMRSNTA